MRDIDREHCGNCGYYLEVARCEVTTLTPHKNIMRCAHWEKKDEGERSKVQGHVNVVGNVNSKGE